MLTQFELLLLVQLTTDQRRVSVSKYPQLRLIGFSVTRKPDPSDQNCWGLGLLHVRCTASRGPLWMLLNERFECVSRMYTTTKLLLSENTAIRNGHIHGVDGNINTRVAIRRETAIQSRGADSSTTNSQHAKFVLDIYTTRIKNLTWWLAVLTATCQLLHP
jgi:hypothetical protein